MTRGDVILCNIPMPSSQLREFKMRPAVIISKDANNIRLEDVTVAVCSSNISRKAETTQFLIEGKEIEAAGIRVPSVVKCETLITVNKSMVVKKLGRLSVRARKELDACLRNALDL